MNARDRKIQEDARAARTQMFQEAAQAPAVVAAQLKANHRNAVRLGAELRTRGPRAVVTAARGSSDHVATFAKYLIETKTATLTSSAALSISSVYIASQRLDNVLVLAISQSGQSPDLLATVEAAKAAGAFILALINATDSPLARLADETILLHAGAERSVAATKTYLASAAAILQFVAHWSADAALIEALDSLPGQLERAWNLDWSAASARLRPARDLYVIGRGLGFGAAQEAALKLKETCALHAEAFSAAEVRHGPMALVKSGFPVLVFSQDDETRAGISELVTSLGDASADVILAGFAHPAACALPTLAANPALQPVLMVQTFYRMANALSLARGLDPDRPPNLYKITETV